ncbi:MAG: helix-turn-helix domain-containing protein [Angelakisella sp.]
MNCSHATLGKNIRTLRNARGLSQEALAQDAQITQSHLGCIERGRGNPTVETLFYLQCFAGRHSGTIPRYFSNPQCSNHSPTLIFTREI